MNIEWKDIKGFEGLYKISNTGLVISVERISVYKDGRSKIIKEKILKQSDNGNGYNKVNLFDLNHKAKNYYIHRLVAEHFVDNPNNYNVVNHKDENTKNNNFINLEWCTNKYNTLYSDIPNRNNKNKMIKVYVKNIINNEIQEFESINEASRKLNITKSCIKLRLNKNIILKDFKFYTFRIN